MKKRAILEMIISIDVLDDVGGRRKKKRWICTKFAVTGLSAIQSLLEIRRISTCRIICENDLFYISSTGYFGHTKILCWSQKNSFPLFRWSWFSKNFNSQLSMITKIKKSLSISHKPFLTKKRLDKTSWWVP